MAQGFRELRVWHEAVAVARQVYVLTSKFPRDELFGMTSQMRRSSVSVASNIAEGSARQTKKEFIQFLYVTLGSLAELETQLEIVVQVGLAKRDSILDLIEALNKLSRSVNKLQQSLRPAK
jgi:four helix bundle protein